MDVTLLETAASGKVQVHVEPTCLALGGKAGEVICSAWPQARDEWPAIQALGNHLRSLEALSKTEAALP